MPTCGHADATPSATGSDPHGQITQQIEPLIDAGARLYPTAIDPSVERLVWYAERLDLADRDPPAERMRLSATWTARLDVAHEVGGGRLGVAVRAADRRLAHALEVVRLFLGVREASV